MGLVWVPAAVAVAGCLAAALAFGTRFRLRSATVPSTVTGLTVIVPIRGVDDSTEANLGALLASVVPVPVEYLIAMESADDPAHAVATRLQERHPGVRMSIVLSGRAEGRMGKQHNLRAGAKQASYPAIASMDADVRVAPDTLAIGVAHLTEGVGVAYFLPQYVGPGPAGGRLVALYSNYYYQLNMGALALGRSVPFITGGLWLMSAEARARIGDLGRFATTVADDAAIGRAVVESGLRTTLVPRTVTIPFERLGLGDGLRHLHKWLTMLRAEGWSTYLAILVTWHPILWAAVAAIVVGLSGAVALAVGGLLVAIVVRLAATAVLHRVAYGWSGAWLMVAVPLYEVVGVPLLFVRGLFSRHVDWRGTRYRIGRRGLIEGTSPVVDRRG
jgi:ceramide glucosyltransferase